MQNIYNKLSEQANICEETLTYSGMYVIRQTLPQTNKTKKYGPKTGLNELQEISILPPAEKQEVQHCHDSW